MKKIIILLLVTLIFCSSLFAKKYVKGNELDEEIRDTIELVHKYITDCTDDDKINCMDYALMFYTIWNKRSRKKGYEKCDIYVNKTVTLNHAFIGIYYYNDIDGKYYIKYIEPQAKYYESFDMKTYWGFKYNSQFNKKNTDAYLYWFGIPKIPAIK